MELVRRYADWWNIPANHIRRLAELAPAAGSARVSMQQMIGFVREGSDPDEGARGKHPAVRQSRVGPGLR